MKELKVKPFIGFTDAETIKLDFDNTTFKNVRYWALKTMKWFRLRGFIILKSSKNNYHVVFDRHVSWETNMSIVGWVAILSKSVFLLRWLAMQCIKKASTLRVSTKGEKANPRIVFRHGHQGQQIKNFLKYRNLIRRICRSII